MKAALLLLFILAFSISVAGSITLDLPTLQKYIDTYNGRIDKAPDVLKSLLGNEKINVDIIKNNGSVYRVGLDVQKARVNRTVEGGLKDPSIVITSTESAINAVRFSKDPIVAFQNQTDLGQISIQGNNILASAKVEALLSSAGVLKFFSGIFFG